MFAECLPYVRYLYTGSRVVNQTKQLHPFKYGVVGKTEIISKYVYYKINKLQINRVDDGFLWWELKQRKTILSTLR